MKNIKRKILRNLFPKYYLRHIFLKKTGYSLNLETPKTFNEKIQWLKYYELPNNPLIIKCADKSYLPQFLIEKGFANYAPPLLGIWKNFDDIPLSQLPNRFVLKINNASGFNIFIEDKDQVNWGEVKKQIIDWQNRDYGLSSLERHYSKIPTKIIAEDFLDLDKNLLEYNFYCFNGIPRFCRVIRFDNKITKEQKASCYSPEWGGT